jgi:O-antigen/teichoic acid export membrane protein
LAINAAYGLSQQVNGFLLFFANSIVRPMRPIIIKKEGGGEHEQMKMMALTTSRITFLMLLLVVVPLFVNMPFILSIWLKEVPEGTQLFCQAFLLIVLINQITIGLSIALESVGKIRRLQTFVGAMHILPIPVAYVLFTNGFPAQTIMYCIIVEEVICVVLRMIICAKDAQIPVWRSLTQIVLPCITMAGVTFALAILGSMLSSHSLIQILITTILTVVNISLLGYYCFFNEWEKAQIKGMIGNIRAKVLRK